MSIPKMIRYRGAHYRLAKDGEVPRWFSEKVHNELYDVLDDLFIDLAEDFDLVSGDWAPDQESRLVRIVDDLSDLLEDWAAQNIGM